MEKAKLRRTLYIGLGGTGIRVIKEVKKNFLNNSSDELPPMVKFLCIDTNKGDLDGQTREDPEKLGTLEKIHLKVDEPASVLHSGGSQFDWLPKSNRDSIVDIEGTGAGQVRSNGRFILEYDKITHNQLPARLERLYHEIAHATNDDRNYDLLPTNTIDVHLIFSLAGGTGSGMFLSVANLVRQYVPEANLMAYAFSPSFFRSVGVNWNIKHNTYGALLELDYYMHGGKGKYTNISKGITKKLFDGVMYIDNRTCTNSHQEDSYTYEFDEVKTIVAHALYLSAGEIGTNARSIVDNLRSEMKSGGYDVPCHNGVKGAWVSSLGVSQIVCRPRADIEFKTIESAYNILNNLLKGERSGLAITETVKWIVDLNIDESNGDEDGNYMINRILPPDSFKTLRSQSKILVNDKGEYDDSEFIKINDTAIKSHKEDVGTIVEEKRKAIIRKIKEELFPSAGSKTIGIEKIVSTLAGLKADILQSKGILQDEIAAFKDNQDKTETVIKDRASDIIKKMSHNRFIRDNDSIEENKKSIRLQREKYYKFQLEIDRRLTAIEVYDRLDLFIADYVKEHTGIFAKIKNNIESGLSKLNEVASGTFGQKQLSPSSTSIDLTSRANELTTSATESNPVDDWNDFFDYTGEISVENLAAKSDWSNTAIKYFNSKQSASTSGPIIIRVMNTFSRDERIKKYEDLIHRARPLMDYSKFGEVKFKEPSDFIFVSYPCNISENENETKAIIQQFKEEFKEALGSDKFDIIPQKDNNRIIVYHQMGVIPPFYILGVSFQKNQRKDPESYEAKYLEYINMSSVRRKIKPFTDTYFERAFENDGHSLDSEYQGQSKSKIKLWVDSFILGIIERKNGLYRIPYDRGTRDLSTIPVRSWQNFSETRAESYQIFESAPVEFIEDLAKRIDSLLVQPEISNSLNKYYGVGDDKINMYLSKCLMNVESEEYQMVEVKNQLNKELDYLQGVI